MQFNVPQFIDVESKIIGPISARQFIIILVTLGVCFIWYELLSMILFSFFALLTCGVGGMIAFGKINGQQMHYFILNFLQTLRRPALRVWRRPTFQPNQEYENTNAVAPVVMMVKDPLGASQLARVSLIVDTGGAFRPEDAVQSLTPSSNNHGQ